jgi:hypothetical protein
MRSRATMSRVPIVGVLLAVVATISAQTVPRDFTLHAHFTPGGMPDYSQPQWYSKNPNSWDLVIRNDGNARLDIAKTVLRGDALDVNHVRSATHLSASGMSALVTAIQKADFFALSHSIPPDPNLHHARVLFLSVRLNGSKNEVQVFCPVSLHGNRVALRVQRLWAALLRELPSPNRNLELQCFY